jgi:hypothetical protein
MNDQDRLYKLKEEAAQKQSTMEQGYGMNDCRPKVNCCAAREAARSLLDHMTRKIEMQAEALDVLKRVIPWDLISPRDEERLYELFVQLNRP